MDKLKAMRIYCRVVETENFSYVAKEMRLSQSNVSKSIAYLEDHLNTRLLNRNTRQQQLTTKGAQYYEQCAKILNSIDDAESSLEEQPSLVRGVLRVSAPTSYGLHVITPVIKSFIDVYPSISIDLVFCDHNLDLIKEKIDLAFRLGPLENSTLVSRKLPDIARSTVATPRYTKLNGTPNTLKDLEGHQCIVFTSLANKNRWFFSHNQSIEVPVSVSVNTPDAMLKLTLSDLGVSVLPKFLLKNDLKNGNLISVLPEIEPMSIEVHALYPKRHLSPKLVTIFLDHFIENDSISEETHS